MRKIQGRKVKNNQNGLVSFSSINVCMNQKICRIFLKKYSWSTQPLCISTLFISIKLLKHCFWKGDHF